MAKLTKTKVIRLSQEQHNTLIKMKYLNVDVGKFIRNAIKEKINNEYKDLIKVEKPLNNFERELSKFKEQSNYQTL